MSEVTRYHVNLDASEDDIIWPHEQGDWVTFEDYKAISSKLEGYRNALRAIAELRGELRYDPGYMIAEGMADVAEKALK